LTDYQLQRKWLYCRLSNEWADCGNNVWFCTLRIVGTVRAASFCHCARNGIRIFKGLIGMVGTDLRTWLGVKQMKLLSRSIGIRRTPQATTPTPNAATQVQSGWIMPDFAFLCTTDAWNSRYVFGG